VGLQYNIPKQFVLDEMELLRTYVKLHHIIKFRKVPELFPNREVGVVGTDQLCDYDQMRLEASPTISCLTSD